MPTLQLIKNLEINLMSRFNSLSRETLNVIIKIWWLENQILQSNNHFHNIFRLFDVLPNFPFTTSETMRDCYL